MKDRVKVSLVQFAPAWLDGPRNAERMRDFVLREADSGADLIVFPETANIGYVTPLLPGDPLDYPGTSRFSQFYQKYLEAAEPLPGPTSDAISSAARKCGVYVVFGMSQRHPTLPGILHNTAVFIGPQGLIGVHYKMHPVMNEKLFFYAGRMADVYPTELGNIAMMVCYDSYFPELARTQALRGAEIVCALFNGPRLPGINSDKSWFRRLTCVRAKENAVYFLSCLRSGSQGDFTYVGHSSIASPTGRCLALPDTEGETAVRAELTNEELVRARVDTAVFRDRRPELYGGLCEPTDSGEPGAGSSRDSTAQRAEAAVER